MSTEIFQDVLEDDNTGEYGFKATVRFGIEQLHTLFCITTEEGESIQDTLDSDDILQDKLL